MSTAADSFKGLLGERINSIKEAGTWKTERVITSKQGPGITVQGSDEKMLNFCANNYLGLSVSVDCVLVKIISKADDST